MLAVVCNGVRRLHRELVGQLNEVEDNCESTNVCGSTNCTQRVHKILTPHCYSQQLVTLWQLYMKSIEIIVIYSTIICKSGKMNHPKSLRGLIHKCLLLTFLFSLRICSSEGFFLLSFSLGLDFCGLLRIAELYQPYYLIIGNDKDNFVIFHVLTRFSHNTQP